MRIFILLLLFSFPLRAQSILLPSVPQRVNTVSELRDLPINSTGVAILLGTSALNDGNGDIFYYSPGDTQADNGMSIIKATGVSTGSWIRLKILNSKIGSYTGSGALATTSYVVTHNLGSVPSFVTYSAKSAAAGGTSYENKAARTATTFTIVFTANPAVGTNNLTFDWLVRL